MHLNFLGHCLVKLQGKLSFKAIIGLKTWKVKHPNAQHSLAMQQTDMPKVKKKASVLVKRARNCEADQQQQLPTVSHECKENVSDWNKDIHRVILILVIQIWLKPRP